MSLFYPKTKNFRKTTLHIDGCLKAEGNVEVTALQDQAIYAVSEASRAWLDGELSNVRYFAIGDSCSALDNTGISDINDNGSCDCLDGFSGATCQDVETPVDPCNPCTVWKNGKKAYS